MQEIAKWVRQTLTDWCSACNSGGPDVQKNNSDAVKVEVLVWVVVDLFFPFIEKRHEHTQDGTHQRIYFLMLSPCTVELQPNEWRSLITGWGALIRCRGHGSTPGLLWQISYWAIVCRWCSQSVRACWGWAFWSCWPWGCKFLVPGSVCCPKQVMLLLVHCINC